MMVLLAFFDGTNSLLADTAALAAVALIGYLFGKRTQSPASQDMDSQLNHELTRATEIAQHLQTIASRIRKDVASHQSNIAEFKTRLGDLQSRDSEDGWQKLSSEAELLLVPTMKLATDLSLAYDELRRESIQLMNFAGSRTDPETGILNRRAMEDQIEVLLSLHEQNSTRFSLAIFSLDLGTGSEEDVTPTLIRFAELLTNCARETDIVTRYSPEEFVVLMPQTSLAGAMIFSERLMNRVDSVLNLVLAGGIVEVQKDDDEQKLLSRADSALYSARANGFSCLYQHNGKNIRPHEPLSSKEKTLESTG